MAGVVARQVVYSGTVQGVGFRRRAEQVAQDFAVAGYVQNLADGSVELVAEGESAAVAAFLGRVRAVLAREIEAARERDVPPAGLAGFVIRR
jgi:acylphosphatase